MEEVSNKFILEITNTGYSTFYTDKIQGAAQSTQTKYRVQHSLHRQNTGIAQSTQTKYRVYHSLQDQIQGVEQSTQTKYRV